LQRKAGKWIAKMLNPDASGIRYKITLFPEHFQWFDRLFAVDFQ
jgi:hypothetical protein